MKRAGITLVALLVFSLNLHADSQRDRDGNWWRNLTVSEQSTYMIGFYDGMELGHNFSYWNFLNKKTKETCVADTSESYKTFKDKYAQNVTNIQLADGLNTFYSDYRNRAILIHNAVWLVLNSIAGKPQAELDKMIESFRKAAASSER
jgi:chloramphenicol O-acetyltransferase